MKAPCVFTFLLMLSLLLSSTRAADVDFDGPPIASVGSDFSYVISCVDESEERATPTAGEPSPDDQGKRAAVVDPVAINHWEFSRWGGITRIIMSNRLGRRGEIWVKGNLKIVRPPEGTGYYVDDDPPDRDRFPVNLERYGYPHTGWISAANYVGKVKIREGEALYFCEPKPETSHGDNRQKPPLSPVREGWVDLRNRAPLYVKEGGVTYSYQILPPSKFTLPKAINEYLERLHQAMKPFITPIANHPRQ